MINETVQLLSRFATHPDHGVNELAGSIPRKNIDATKPDDDAPPIVAIVDDVNDEGVAAALDPRDVPCIMFFGDSSAIINLPGYRLAREVKVVAAFVTEENADPLTSERACGYLLRALQMTFGRYNSQDLSKGYRTLNGIKVLEIKRVVEQRLSVADGRRKMWGFLDLQVIVVDTLQ